MSIKETYEWAKEKMDQWDGLVKETGAVATEAQKKVAVPPFARFENPSFCGDVIKQGGDLFFHFFPTANSLYNLGSVVDSKPVWTFETGFSTCLADSFLAVFKHEDRLCWDYVNEMHSWVVRCMGYADNPLVDDLIERVLCAIKERYEK